MAASLPIPVYTSLDEAYTNLGSAVNHAVRWSHLAEEFQKRFGRKPEYIARAPGRVNLIGEHIDYALFGVLPAAVERDILIACASRPPSSASEHGAVAAENLAGSKYPAKEFAPARDGKGGEWRLDIDKRQLNWESYVKAGYFGVLNTFFPPTSDVQPLPVDILVTGSVPAGSGLSSSAAMVVASTLTFLAVNDKLDGMTKGRLVEMAMENEQRVGVNSGGMDQAASVISTTNSALYISFYPKLSAQPIPLPSASSPVASSTSADPPAPLTAPGGGGGGVFVCANSLVISDKVVHSKTRYNLRVVETLVSARILCRVLSLPLDVSGQREKVTLRQVVGRYLGLSEQKDVGEDVDIVSLERGLKELGMHVAKLLPGKGNWKAGEEEGVTMEEMVEMSGLDEKEFKQVYLSSVDVEATHFQLYKRTEHVFSEALRVLQFRQVCLAQSEADKEMTCRALGALMNESQQSCATLYECSCPELDELTRLSREAGAYGSRLTGAGWGGCTVSLVAESQVDEFINKVKQTYPPYRNLEGEALKEVIFATKPSSGAFVYKF